jgi:hypothetical protein
MSEPTHIISLGAGVQSSTMALMAACGELTPMPSFAVFADTGDEPKAVYEWLEFLRRNLPFPVAITGRWFGKWGPEYPSELRRLSAWIIENDFSQIPCFTEGANGRPTLGKRQCTRHWKIDPVKRKIRSRLNVTGCRLPDGYVTLWQGISWDEISRMKPSREPWMTHRFPLIDLKMSRQDCLSWMKARGFPEPPKSACLYCPYKDRARWLADKTAGGQDWEVVQKVDAILAPRGEFLTADLKRIDDIDFSKPLPKSEDPNQMHLWGNECEGMCGV